MHKVLVIDDIHTSFFELLQSKGIATEYKLDLSKEELQSIIGQYAGVVVRSKFYFDKKLISAMQPGQFIARAGAGMDNIDVDDAKNQNIVLINAPEGNRDAVAEHVIGMVLSFYRNIAASDQSIRNGVWQREEFRGRELGGRTFGIIGYGNTGQALAKKLSGFGMNVIAHDKYRSNFSDQFVQEVSLNQVIADSDIISLHVPLQSDTRHLINSKTLEWAQNCPLIVNSARGKVINTSDLLAAMKNGKVLGACLDVLENEAINALNLDEKAWFENLVASQRVVLTSHIAGWTIESYVKIATVLAAKITQFLESR